MILRRRHVIKAIMYRLYSTCITILIAMIVTGDLNIGLIIGPIELVVKSVSYYLYERWWLRTAYGIKAAKRPPNKT